MKHKNQLVKMNSVLLKEYNTMAFKGVDESLGKLTDDLKNRLQTIDVLHKELKEGEYHIRELREFIKAAKEGQISKIQEHLKKGIDVNALDYDNNTALFWASWQGHEDIVELLCKIGAYVDIPCYNEATALIAAAMHGHTRCVEILLNYNANINLQDNKKQTALLLAVSSHGKTDIVELLCRRDAAVDIHNIDGATALLAAAEKGFTKCVEILLKYQANINFHAKNKQTAMYLASLNGHVDTLELLCSQGAAVDIADLKGATALIISAQKGHKKCTEILLNHKAMKNWQDEHKNTALHWASWSGHVGTVDLLCAQGAIVDIPNIQGATPLLTAAQYGNSNCLEVLLNYNATLNWKDTINQTALLWASFNGPEDIVKMLGKHGAELNTPNNKGVTALMAASGNGHIKCVEILVRNGANINWKSNIKQSAFFYESQHGNAEQSRVHIDIDGNTAITLASMFGHISCAEYLLKQGADPTIKNGKGQSALEMMREKPQFADIIKLPTTAATTYIRSIQRSWITFDTAKLVFPFQSNANLTAAYYKLIMGCEKIGWKCIAKSVNFASFTINKENDIQLIVHYHEESCCLLMELYISKAHNNTAMHRIPAICQRLETSNVLKLDGIAVTASHVCPCLDDKGYSNISKCLVNCNDLELNRPVFADAVCPIHQKVIHGDRMAVWFKLDENKKDIKNDEDDTYKETGITLFLLLFCVN